MRIVRRLKWLGCVLLTNKEVTHDRTDENRPGKAQDKKPNGETIKKGEPEMIKPEKEIYLNAADFRKIHDAVKLLNSVAKKHGTGGLSNCYSMVGDFNKKGEMIGIYEKIIVYQMVLAARTQVMLVKPDKEGEE